MSTLDEIEARITDCKSYKFGMRNADTLAHFDAPFLLALVRQQAAALGAVLAVHKPAHAPVEPWAAGYKWMGHHCAHDGQHWPCETIAELEAAK